MSASPDTHQGLHVTNSVFESFLHGLHALLDPVCAATAGYDESHGWAPCSTAKLLLVALFHVALFAFLQRQRARAPPVHRKSIIQQANEVFSPSGGSEGSSSSIARSSSAQGAAGLVQRK